MVMAIEAIPEQSFILIEEIENGLHPIATVRMVEYLIEMSHRKNSQVIFTTHSNDALAPLPAKGIWAAMGNRAFQGKLDIDSLRAITGQIDAQLAIFVEDDFSKAWVQAAIRQAEDLSMEQIEVYPMEGDSVAANMNKFHNQDPAASFPSICFVDGDSTVEEDLDNNVYKLPGQSPESYIFYSVLEEFDHIGGRLAVSLLQPYENTGEVREVLEQVRLTNHDPHLLFSQIGLKLGFLPESTVKDAFANIWAQTFPSETENITRRVRENFPRRDQ